MSADTTQVKCPECGTSIDVQDILKHQLEDELKKKYETRHAQAEKKLEEEKEKLAQEKSELEKRINEEVKSKAKALEKEIQTKLTQEQS